MEYKLGTIVLDFILKYSFLNFFPRNAVQKRTGIRYQIYSLFGYNGVWKIELYFDRKAHKVRTVNFTQKFINFYRSSNISQQEKI